MFLIHPLHHAVLDVGHSPQKCTRFARVRGFRRSKGTGESGIAGIIAQFADLLSARGSRGVLSASLIGQGPWFGYDIVA